MAGSKSKNLQQDDYSFLSGGGEMGSLIRAKEWSKTTIGNPKTWPQSLRTTLGIVLNSKFPMFLWWGPELICFYNDAYRPSLGENGKHPEILGMPAEKAWPEIWEIIQPLIRQVLDGGEATWSEDQLIPIFRNGKLEDVYWTFSYSPVNDESGTVTGVLVTCNETTEKIKTFKSLEESNRRYLNNIIQAPAAMCIFRGKNHIVEIANELMLELWGKTEAEVLNKPIFEGLPEAKGQGLEVLIDNVFKTGEKFAANERQVNLPRKGKIETTYINFVWEALKDTEGKITGIVAIATDVTVQVLERKKIEESEEQLRFAMEGGELGTFDFYPLTGKIIWSHKTKEFFGLPPDAEVNYDIFMKGLHPKDKENAKRLAENGIQLNDGGIYELEYRTIGITDGKLRWIRAKGKATFNEDGSIIRYIGITQDITERKRTEEALIESDRRFRNMVKQAPIGISILKGPQYIIEMANDAYLKFVDREETDFVGKPLFVSLPEVKESVENLLYDVLTTGKPFYGIEYPVPINRYGRNELSYFNFLYHPIKEDDGKVSGIIVTVSDVTESVKAKHFIIESERQFRNMVMQSPIPMTILKGKEYIIETANKTMFQNIWRKEENEVLGRSLLEVFPELNEQKYPELLLEVFTTGKTHSEKESIAYVDGKDGMKKFYLDFEYAALFDTDDTISGIIITVNDVTEKVEARIIVEESEKEFRQLADSLPEMVWTTDRNGKQVFASKRWKEFTGLDPYDSISFEKMVHPDDKENIIKTWTNCIATGEIYKTQVRLKSKEGDYQWFYVNGEPVRDETGKIEKWIGAFTNFNEQKKAEQELIEALLEIEKSEIRFRTLADNMSQFAWMADEHGSRYWFNQRWYEYTGTSPEQMLGEGWQKQHHPEHVDRVMAGLKNAIKTGENWEDIYPLRSKDGNYNWFLSRASAIRDAGGKIVQWFGTNTDITVQKNAEVKIRESEERFRNVANSAPVLIWMAGPDKLRNFFNKEWLQFTGRSFDQEKGNGWAEGVHPEDFTRCLSFYLASFDKREEFYIEYRLKRYDGEYRWIGAKGVPRFNAAGIFEGYIGACMDIHERVIYQQKLKEDEERLNIIINASELGTWDLNLKTKEVHYTDRYLQILGYDKWVDLTHEQILRHLHPEDLPIREAAFKQALKTGILQYESRIIWIDQSIHWIEGKGKVFFDDKKEPSHLIGTVRDITEEKYFQQELLDREQKFRLLADSMPEFVWTGDEDGILDYFNQSVYKYTGLSPKQLLKGGLLQIVHPEDREENLRLWIESVSTGRDFLFEHRFRRQDGEYRWQLSRAVPQKDAAGNIQMWVGTSTDIHQFKEQEQQKDLFISMASHELKTPVTSIKGYVQMLQSMYAISNDNFLKNSLNIVDKQIVTLTKLIAELLDLSKIKSGSLVLYKENFKINDLVKDIITEIKYTSSGKNIIFSKVGDPLVFADRDRIGQVLINFLTNAVKYSPDSINIKVKSRVKENNVFISVQDAGIGINKIDQEKIFQRFYRVEGKNEKTFPGFGIGLFIASEIIKRHEGDIGVKSEPGKGSCFYFSIPLLK